MALRSGSSLLAPAALLAWAACSQDLAINEVKYACTASTECLAGFECDPGQGVCVPIGGGAADPEPEPAPEPSGDADSSKVEPAPETVPETAVEPAPETPVEPAPETVTDPDDVPAPEPEPLPDAALEPDTPPEPAPPDPDPTPDPEPFCGNGSCDGGEGETCASCAKDCGVCPDPEPDPLPEPAPDPDPDPGPEPEPLTAEELLSKAQGACAVPDVPQGGHPGENWLLASFLVTCAETPIVLPEKCGLGGALVAFDALWNDAAATVQVASEIALALEDAGSPLLTIVVLTANATGDPVSTAECKALEASAGAEGVVVARDLGGTVIDGLGLVALPSAILGTHEGTVYQRQDFLEPDSLAGIATFLASSAKATAQIDAVRKKPNGVVSPALPIERALVTDVTKLESETRFVVQARRQGPAILAKVDGQIDLGRGDVVTLSVKAVGLTNGVETATSVTLSPKLYAGLSVEALVQDLSGGATLSVVEESELVRLRHVELLATADPLTWTLRWAQGQPVPSLAPLRFGAGADPGVCEGAWADLLAPVSRVDGEFGFEVFGPGAFELLDKDVCYACSTFEFEKAAVILSENGQCVSECVGPFGGSAPACGDCFEAHGVLPSCTQCLGGYVHCQFSICFEPCASGGGGDCGACVQENCSPGFTECQCEPDACGAVCCSGGSTCFDPKVNACCFPKCPGKECGDDGCGGSCGSCGAFESCEDGECVPADCGGGCECIVVSCFDASADEAATLCSGVFGPECTDAFLDAYAEHGCGRFPECGEPSSWHSLCTDPACSFLLPLAGQVMCDLCHYGEP